VGICIAGFCETVIARVFGLFKTVVLARFAILVKIDFLFFIHLQKLLTKSTECTSQLKQ
jgi:hypothetical protein